MLVNDHYPKPLRYQRGAGVVAAREDSPDVAVLREGGESKVVLVALAAGQALPAHLGD